MKRKLKKIRPKNQISISIESKTSTAGQAEIQNKAGSTFTEED